MDQFTETCGLRLASSRNEDHITLHVAGGLVMLAVRDLPAEVGDEETGMEDPAGEIVDEGGIGEGTVTTLMCNDPKASAEETLENSVEGPQTSTGRLGGDVLRRHIVVENVEGGGEAQGIAEDISVALEGRTLEAVPGDGIMDLLDGEVRNSELVAVRVEETAVLGFGLCGGFRLRGERGERGVRSGRTR